MQTAVFDRRSFPGQAWLQQFSWTEAGKLGKLEQRRRLAQENSAAREALEREPMFCFETAIKLYYFSHIIYYYEKVQAAPHYAFLKVCEMEKLYHLLFLHFIGCTKVGVFFLPRVVVSM